MVKAEAQPGRKGGRCACKQIEKKKTLSVASTSETQWKRGRKTREENMQNLMHAYHRGTPAQGKSIISTWEAELNIKAATKLLPTEEWDSMLIDLTHNRGRQTLFRQKVQLYWVMTNLLARAMTTNRDLEEPSQARQEGPSLKDIQREIQVVQVQQYNQNVRFGRVEKQIQSLLQNEVPGSSAKDSAPIESLDH